MGSPEPLDLIRTLSLDLLRQPDVIEPILDLLPIGIAIADDRMCAHTRVNAALARQLGLDARGHTSLKTPAADHVPLKSSTDGRPMTLENRPMYRAARDGVEVKGTVVDIVRADGTSLTLMEYAAPLFNSDHTVRGAIG